MSALRWHRPAWRRASGETGSRPPGPTGERSLVRLVAILLGFESSLYSAVTPVLPHYAHTLHASKPALGLLAAAYSAGLLPGSLAGGWMASTRGVRRTTLAGLTVFGVAVAAFGFATNLVTLDALRVIQGASCGLIWGGALTWVIAAAPRERRGATIGAAMAAATFGTLLGPLFGTAAAAIGTRPVFGALGILSLALAVRTRMHSEPPPAEAAAPRTRLRAVLHRGGVPLGAWLITLEAMTFGATNVLIPLRLSRFGASGVAIGLTFVAASALSTVLAPIVGRVVDRRGTRPPLLAGLAVAAVLLTTLIFPRSALLLALASVVALGGPLAAYMIPAVTLMTSSAEGAGVSLIVVTTLTNLAYALGETIGAPAAAGLSEATSDAVPILGIVALILISLWPVSRVRQRAAAQPSTGSSVTSRATSAA